MNKHIKAHIFSIVACLMINTCLFAGTSYTRHQAIIIILSSLSSPTKQAEIAIKMMDEILSEKAEKIDEGMISQEELDAILSTYHGDKTYLMPTPFGVLFVSQPPNVLYRKFKKFDGNLTEEKIRFKRLLRAYNKSKK